MEMKAAVFQGKHQMDILQKTVPTPHAGEVLVKVMACGICGTDVHIFEGDKGCGDTQPGTVLGHEFAGIVEAVGEGVTDFTVGDRVCVDPNDTCGSCYYCQHGMAHFCTGMKGIGTMQDGGFAQFVVAPQKQCHGFSERITFAQAAMTEPVACCLHGMDLCNLKAGDTVVVIGGGMIGLLMLQLAKLAGAGVAVLLEPVEAKRETAKKLGADLCIDPLTQDVNAILAAEKLHQVDCVIECAGLPKTVEQAIDIAGKGATVMLFGLTKPDDTVAIKPFTVFEKELSIKASYINPYTQERALTLIDRNRLDVASMVYREISLEELSTVLSDPKQRALGKFIVNPQL